MCLKYDNTIPGFSTLVALITAESTFTKVIHIISFVANMVFFRSTALVGVVIDADGIVCVCSWFVCRGRLVLRIHMC